MYCTCSVLMDLWKVTEDIVRRKEDATRDPRQIFGNRKLRTTFPHKCSVWSCVRVRFPRGALGA